MYYHGSAPGGTAGVLDMEGYEAAAESYFNFQPDDVKRSFRSRYPNVRVSLMRTLLADGAFGHQEHQSGNAILHKVDCQPRG